MTALDRDSKLGPAFHALSAVRKGFVHISDSEHLKKSPKMKSELYLANYVAFL